MERHSTRSPRPLPPTQTAPRRSARRWPGRRERPVRGDPRCTNSLFAIMCCERGRPPLEPKLGAVYSVDSAQKQDPARAVTSLLNCTVMHPVFIGAAAQLKSSLAQCVQAFDDPFRGEIAGANEACRSVQGNMLEQPVAGRSRCFSGKALAPKGLVERLGNFGFRPVEWMEDADTADEYLTIHFFSQAHIP
jgi:hypothetical protein